jgi:hypothetical protein
MLCRAAYCLAGCGGGDGNAFPKEGRRVFFFVFWANGERIGNGSEEKTMEERWTVCCQKYEEPFVVDEMMALGWDEKSCDASPESISWDVGFAYFYGGPLMMPVGYQPVISGTMSDRVYILFSRNLPEEIECDGRKIKAKEEMAKIELRLQRHRDDLGSAEKKGPYGAISAVSASLTALLILSAIILFARALPWWLGMTCLIAAFLVAPIPFLIGKKERRISRRNDFLKEKAMEAISDDFFAAKKLSRMIREAENGAEN